MIADHKKVDFSNQHGSQGDAIPVSISGLTQTCTRIGNQATLFSLTVDHGADGAPHCSNHSISNQCYPFIVLEF